MCLIYLDLTAINSFCETFGRTLLRGIKQLLQTGNSCDVRLSYLGTFTSGCGFSELFIEGIPELGVAGPIEEGIGNSFNLPSSDSNPFGVSLVNIPLSKYSLIAAIIIPREVMSKHPKLNATKVS